MTPPAGSAPSSDRGAGPERPRRGYGRALRVGLAVSAVVHLAVLLVYPELDDPREGSPSPILVPSGGEPEQGMTVLRIVEIDAAEESERPLDPEEIMPVEEPLGAPEAPSVDEGPAAELIPPGPSVAERLQPFLADPRLWVELDPSFDDLTLGQILELELSGRIEEWQDSLRSAVAAQRALTDWTYTDDDGKRWGFADGRVYLGDIALPLPFGFGTPVGKRDEVNRRAWEWQEIQRGALVGAVQDSWKERAQAIRARRDAERARARADTTGVRRGGSSVSEGNIWLVSARTSVVPWRSKAHRRRRTGTVDDPPRKRSLTESHLRMSRSHSGRVFYTGLIRALTQVLGSAKGYLGDHGPRVAILAAKIGDRMGLSSEETSRLFLAAVLSDVGMIGLAEEAWEHAVVDLPPDVRARVKRHPVRSEARVGLIPHLDALAPLVRHHHEWWDGSGYPDGLSGREIPVGAQILRLADTVIALSQPRPHRGALDEEAIEAVVARSVGIEFGPEIARTFLGLNRSGYLPAYESTAFAAALERAVGALLPERVSPLSNGQLLAILANLIDAKDPYTAGHSRRVAMLATAVGTHMGFHDHMRSALWAGGYLHDLGKLSVPLRALTKEGRLDLEEEALVRRHAAAGADILEDIVPLRHLAPGARHHHERWDGGGYPDGLRGDQIPLVAQILAVCDSYDAMTSARAYRDSRSHEDALAEIARCSGTHFCPRVANAFLDLPEHIFGAVRAEARASRSPSLMEMPLFPSPAVEPALPLPRAV